MQGFKRVRLATKDTSSFYLCIPNLIDSAVKSVTEEELLTMVNENNKKGKEQKEMVTTAKELMKLMILKLNDELHGQERALITRDMEYLGLLIEDLKIDIEARKMGKKICEWEYENNLLQDDKEVYDWEFQYEWL